MKKVWILFPLLLAACCIGSLMFTACDDISAPSSSSSSSSSTPSDTTADEPDVEDHEEESDYTWDSSDEQDILLQTSLISTSASGVTLSESDTVATITSAGTYRVTGTLNQGRIIVDTDDSDVVRIILDDAAITCSCNAPLDIESADKTIVILEGTANTLTDGSSYTLPSGDDEPNAALYSRDDLTVYGQGGTLTVNGNYNDGIGCKDGLVLHGADITVNANADDGIRGKDYLVVRGGTINVTSVGDGLKSDNEDDSSLGYISIESGTFTITTGTDGDAIQGENYVLIENGAFTITTGGGSSGGTLGDDDSSKGIKAGVLVDIDGGAFTLNTLDDAVHSNTHIVIDGGDFAIDSGDDGMHADASLTINSGTVNITKSYEGIESAIITINDGTLHIVSSDDGVNVAGGNDSSSPGSFNTSNGQYLYIYGGYIAVTATGDGLDANGSIVMTGGTVIVHGPTGGDNGALDYDGGFVLSGGFLVAAGSSGMLQTPGSSSTQYCVALTYRNTQTAGTIVRVQTSGGTDILTFEPSRQYQAVVFSSPDLARNTAYYIYSGGICTGTSEDGLYDGGSYSGGASKGNFSISSIITTKSNL
ncbi:MAG TPA: carbohydrate-binding domain-containing protein [Spirochaetota bacterium]|nr:carbohydrate-binding domain-containing protein [Spirochaetota bacterium]HPR48817.1 carbohydrate-binding domain-containing protein [Spirochaetota bacterium]